MAVRSLLHYALEVPDQTVGEKFIPEQCAWEPRDFPEADALYRWGPPVPDDFGLNREMEA